MLMQLCYQVISLSDIFISPLEDMCVPAAAGVTPPPPRFPMFFR
jgi:hypothetical protein